MRQRERLHAQFFSDWIKNNLKKDFEILDVEKENSEIDVVLYDDDFKEKIFLQCVAYRGEGLLYNSKPANVSVQGNVPKEIIDALSELTMVLVPAQGDKKAAIIEIIKKKEKKYAPDLVKKLTLLIEMTVPKVTPEELKTYFLKGFETKFRGVYFIQLPIPMAGEGDDYGHSGFIYPLKSLYEKS